MKDVASRAGVSLKTVSRVVNGEAGVSLETRQSVDDAIEVLGYRTDLQAQALRRTDRRSHTVGLLISSVANPFDSAIHAALEEVARQNSASVLALSSNNDPETARAGVAVLAQHQIDGLVFSPVTDDQSWLAQILGKRPVVAVDREPGTPVADAVVSDNRVGALRATRHLLSQGHTKIAFFGDREQIQTARARRSGFEQAMQEAGIETLAELWRPNLAGEEAARMAAHEMLTGPTPPTSIFAAQNTLTAGVLRALRDLQLDERVAVVSFDDLPYAELFKVGLTAITQDPYRIGQIAAERLFGRINGEITGEPRTITVPTGFEIRGSGEIPPAR